MKQFKTFNNMKKINVCNDWLKTREGLQYLLLKFQNNSVVNAIREFRTNVSCPSYKF